MRQPVSRVAISAVLLLLGFLIVVQLRSQAVNDALSGMSAQDLTVLVANLTTRNDQLRVEIGTLERQRQALVDGVERGDTSAGQIRSDLDRIQAWSGSMPVTGPGVRVVIEGELPGDAVEQLLNELRNAGAEAIAIAGVRDVPSTVVSGPGGAATIAGVLLTTPVEIETVGHPETMTGSLTRAGGPIAQLGARFPEVVVTVVPEDAITLPATERDLAPVLGRPRL